ncbi:MAG: SurA N-terminal domain-containing protein [Marinobacter sp.]|uniref:SurA N-terminal domain-containing protein n=1 Tax=Marinobacter sp. TaxID=50741 RepID=UPI00299E2937|nr:SurA N-terminal domain-containing protein [Marinobacter sp.]MDX1633704.1 SurA N-terminal domain-containing protein [Marinobacter sp.]
MLQDIRENAQGTIAKIIIGLLIVALSMFGVDAIIGGFSGEPEVATVNDQEITEREFNRVLQMERQRRLSEMQTPDPSLLDDDQIRRSVLEAMILETVLTQDAQRQDLALSDADIDRLITQMPQFQVDGQFNRDRFVAVIRNMGMGPLEFREAMRRQYVVNQIRGGILESGLASPQAVEHLLRMQYQTRDFRTFTLTPELVADQVNVTEADVEDYYQNNPGEFMQPERVDAAYIELSLDRIAEDIEISEDELREVYQNRASELAGEERRTAHILIEDGDEAEATIAEIQEKLAAGAEFAELAREYSDDLASAEDGGDLGYAGRGVFDGPFEETMFELEEGEISEPVETAYGTHLIKLLDVRKTEPPSFEAMKDELRQELAREQAVTRFAELRTRLADLAYSEDNLRVPAEELGLEVRTRSGITRDGGEPPFDHPGLMRQLFSDDVLQDAYNTEVIDVAEDTSVVARVQEYFPAAQQPLAEVQDEIRQQLQARRTEEALAQLGRDLIARLQDGEALADLNVPVDSWQSYQDVARTSTEISAPVLERAFELPRPESESPSYGLTGYQDDLVVIALDEVTDGDVSERQDEVDQWQQFIASQMAQREYLAYREHLREQAEVERP